MRPRPKQLPMAFEELNLSWMPEQTQEELTTAIADLLLGVVDARLEEGASDELEDPL